MQMIKAQEEEGKNNLKKAKHGPGHVNVPPEVYSKLA